MNNSLNSLIKNIERYAQGTSISHISEISGVPNSTLSRIINRQTNPSLETVDKIANALGVPTSKLLNDSGEVKKANVPSDIVSMLIGQPESVYDSIRTILKTYNSMKNKKTRVGS